ncbi:MAG: hypothetical protein JW709_12920 [Sedimentisphaerales bacterium]|nr:hypothetical protein [Sedimentisphaerales bacterium]
MFTLLTLLAQTQTNGTTPPAAPPPPAQEIPSSFLGHIPIEDIWTRIQELTWIQAVVLVAFGVIYLVYGWRIFKALVVINFAGLGLAGGYVLGSHLGSPLWGALMGTMIFSVVSYPFMKYSVAVLGALAGCIIGGALWRAVSLPEPLVWCGALAGLIAGGFTVFASYKISIMLFSSLQGSMFVVAGILALLNDYPAFGESLTSAVYGHVALLPLLLILPTLAGMYFQQRLHKLNEKWTLPT